MLWKRNTRPAAQLVGWCVCEMCLSVSDKHLKSRRLTTGSAVATAESVVRYELWTVTQIGRHTQFPCSWKRVEIEKRLSNTWTEQQGHNDHHVSRHSSEVMCRVASPVSLPTHSLAMPCCWCTQPVAILCSGFQLTALETFDLQLYIFAFSCILVGRSTVAPARTEGERDMHHHISLPLNMFTIKIFQSVSLKIFI